MRLSMVVEVGLVLFMFIIMVVLFMEVLLLVGVVVLMVVVVVLLLVVVGVVVVSAKFKKKKKSVSLAGWLAELKGVFFLRFIDRSDLVRWEDMVQRSYEEEVGG